MDNFRIIYRILRYLEKAMDYDEVDLAPISAEALGLTQQRWIAIMEMMTDEGYVAGIKVQRSLNGSATVSCSSPRITLKGLEYLQENSLMQKAANLAKGIIDAAT